MISTFKNAVEKGTAIANVIDTGASSVASMGALQNAIKPTENVSEKEAVANNASPAAQDANRAEAGTVEQALCKHLTSIFQTASPKFGEMMIKTIGTHLTEEQAIKDGVNAAVITALTPKITEAVDSAMAKMTDLKNTDSIYNLLKKKIDTAFDTNIRKSVFDNINLLSKDALAEMVDKVSSQNTAAVDATLTTPVVESDAPVKTPAEPEPISATAEAAPIMPIVEEVSVTKGGKRRTRKARRRAAKKSGGATKRRRQRILTLA